MYNRVVALAYIQKNIDNDHFEIWTQNGSTILSAHINLLSAEDSSRGEDTRVLRWITLQNTHVVAVQNDQCIVKWCTAVEQDPESGS